MAGARQLEGLKLFYVALVADDVVCQVQDLSRALP